jgi:transposase
LGYLWCFIRTFIPTPSGRNRFNVLGAIDVVKHEFITITNESYINAESFCLLLVEIYRMNFTIPVSIVLDNARYQRCELVSTTAELLGIELLYLPSYSPHLNIIERLWKWIKKDCLYSKYYASFIEFKKAIEVSLDKVQNSEYKEEMKSLLTCKFQTFKNTHIMT